MRGETATNNLYRQYRAAESAFYNAQRALYGSGRGGSVTLAVNPENKRRKLAAINAARAHRNAIERQILQDANSLHAQYLAARRAVLNLHTRSEELRKEKHELGRELNKIPTHNSEKRIPLARRIKRIGLNIKNLEPRFASLHKNISKLERGLEIRKKWVQPVRQGRVNRLVQKARQKFIAPLWFPATATSPAGLRAAAAIGPHMPLISYENMMARIRQMNRARRAAQHARGTASPSPKRAKH